MAAPMYKEPTLTSAPTYESSLKPADRALFRNEISGLVNRLGTSDEANSRDTILKQAIALGKQFGANEHDIAHSYLDALRSQRLAQSGETAVPSYESRVIDIKPTQRDRVGYRETSSKGSRLRRWGYGVAASVAAFVALSAYDKNGGEQLGQGIEAAASSHLESVADEPTGQVAPASDYAVQERETRASTVVAPGDLERPSVADAIEPAEPAAAPEAATAVDQAAEPLAPADAAPVPAPEPETPAVAETAPEPLAKPEAQEPVAAPTASEQYFAAAPQVSEMNLETATDAAHYAAILVRERIDAAGIPMDSPIRQALTTLYLTQGQQEARIDAIVGTYATDSDLETSLADRAQLHANTLTQHRDLAMVISEHVPDDQIPDGLKPIVEHYEALAAAADVPEPHPAKPDVEHVEFDIEHYQSIVGSAEIISVDNVPADLISKFEGRYMSQTEYENLPTDEAKLRWGFSLNRVNEGNEITATPVLNPDAPPLEDGIFLFVHDNGERTLVERGDSLTYAAGPHAFQCGTNSKGQTAKPFGGWWYYGAFDGDGNYVSVAAADCDLDCPPATSPPPERASPPVEESDEPVVTDEVEPMGMWWDPNLKQVTHE